MTEKFPNRRRLTNVFYTLRENFRKRRIIFNSWIVEIFIDLTLLISFPNYYKLSRISKDLFLFSILKFSSSSNEHDIFQKDPAKFISLFHSSNEDIQTYIIQPVPFS